jgi:phenylalanyl-tRNA synthetase alpha chain
VRAALAELRQAAAAEVAACASAGELEAVQVKYLGRKGSLNGILRGLGQLPADERPTMGALANQVKEEILGALTQRQAGLAAAVLANTLAHERLDVTMPGRQR